MNFKIGYYIGRIGPSSGGIYGYSISLLRYLLSMDEIIEIHLFYLESKDKKKKIDVESNSKIKFHAIKESKYFFYRENISSFFYSSNLFVGSRILNKLSRIFNPYKIIDKIAQIENIQLLHVPFQISPLYRVSIPVIITMHDIQELHFPEFFSPKERLRRSVLYKQAIEDSDHIIVSHNFVKKDIVKYYETAGKKISVADIGGYVDFKSGSKKETENVISSYKLPDNFILYPAVTWEHKNHINLLNAISLLNEQGCNYNLVCTGERTSFYKKIENAIKKSGLEKQIFFIGLIPEGHLVELYRLTRLVVIPSLYEARSGPLLEAMQLTIPVICSNTTTLPEDIGDPAFTFDPTNVEEMASLIKEGMSNKDFIKRNIENSVRRNTHFSTLDYKQDYLKVYRCVLEQ